MELKWKCRTESKDGVQTHIFSTRFSYDPREIATYGLASVALKYKPNALTTKNS